MADGVKAESRPKQRTTPRSLQPTRPGDRGGGALGRVWRSATVRTKVITFFAIMLVWQVVVGLWGRDFMATPLGVIQVAPEMLTTDEVLWSNTATTLESVGIGLLVGGLSGVVLGIAMGRVRALDALLGPYVNGLYATPMIAILPVFTLWFGFSPTTRLALVIFAAFPPLAIAAWDGSRSVPKKYLEVAQTFQAKRRHVWLGIAVPASLPYLIAGFRLASGRALTAAVVAEFLTAVEGLGIYVMNLTRLFDHNEAVVGVAILAVVGVVLTIGAQKLIDKFMPWYRNI